MNEQHTQSIPARHSRAKPSAVNATKGSQRNACVEVDLPPFACIEFASDTQIVCGETLGAARLFGIDSTCGCNVSDLLSFLDLRSDWKNPDLAAGFRLKIQHRWFMLRVLLRDDIGTLFLADVSSVFGVIESREVAMRYLSHDLRSPQVSIIALAELAQDDYPAFQRLGGMAKVAELARKTVSLSEDFLIISQAPQLCRSRFSPVPLLPLVCGVVSQLDGVCRNAGVAIEVQYNAIAKEASVHGIRAFLARAVLNLLDNAVKASAPTSRVIVEIKETTTGFVAICVHDSAGGLPADIATALQMPLFEDEETWGRLSVREFGFGLQVARLVARVHGGEFIVVSNPGRGSMIGLTLPQIDKKSHTLTSYADKASVRGN
jgi:signal transduction histidine kinase